MAPSHAELKMSGSSIRDNPCRELDILVRPAKKSSANNAAACLRGEPENWPVSLATSLWWHGIWFSPTDATLAECYKERHA